VKKAWWLMLTLLLLIGGVYAWVWWESFERSKEYFEQAARYEQEGRLMEALKGEEFFDEERNRYEMRGGYEHVIAIWSDPWALPKPPLVGEAKQRMDRIIHEKLSPEEGLAIFQKYFRLSNQNLPQILLASGRKWKERKETDKAKEVFQLAMQAFGHHAAIRQEIEKELESLKRAEE